MATLVLRKGTGTPTTAKLTRYGEPAYNYLTGKLYIRSLNSVKCINPESLNSLIVNSSSYSNRTYTYHYSGIPNNSILSFLICNSIITIPLCILYIKGSSYDFSYFYQNSIYGGIIEADEENQSIYITVANANHSLGDIYFLY